MKSNIQNVVEWKDTESAGEQKRNKGTFKKVVCVEGAGCKCNYKRYKVLKIHLKDCCV